jgi:uncharacterized membrane protein YuzA (DUF378 family)
MLDRLVHLIILIGALNWGFVGLLRFNVIMKLTSYIFNPRNRIHRLIYIIIGLAAGVKLFKRDYYLPFLGKAAFPCGSLKLKYPKNADVATKIKTKPNANVIYWASEGTNDIVVKNPLQAYDKYANAGVALSDNDGIATLKLRNPSAYNVPLGFTLKPHVHYRTCLGNGMLSPIRTAFLV